MFKINGNNYDYIGIVPDNSDNLWLACRLMMGGAYKFEGEQISAICTDADGTMWCGSKYLHKYSEGVFTAYAMPDDVAINSLVAIDGMIYIGTANGIYVFDGQQITLLNLGTNAIGNVSGQKTQSKATYILQGIKVKGDMLRKGNVYIQDRRKIVK